MPVLPDVGSRIVIPGFNAPRSSASFISAAPMRHFTENVGLRASILASTAAFASPGTRFKRTSGELPMDSALLEYMAIKTSLVKGEICFFYGAKPTVKYEFIRSREIPDNTNTWKIF
jgi:hypothetical protein